MAVGKSTVGRLLAEQLQLQFVDLDREIEKREGRSISMLFGVSEAFFREKETEVLCSLMSEKNIVLSLGGGTLHFGDNARRLQESFQLFTLQAPWELIEQRIVDSDRPLAREARQLFVSRQKGYEIGCQIRTEGRSPEQVKQEIVTYLRLDEP